jgi:cytochrome c oxidase subunit 4
MANHSDRHDDGEVHGHASSVQFYGAILGALFVLTITTYGLSLFHLGALNLALAIVIATVKSALVVTFFMHLKDDTRFNAIVFLSALLFAGVFLAYTLNDTETRGVVDPQWGPRVDPRTGVLAPGTPAEVLAPVLPSGGEGHH